jgi:zinc transporter ZupT
MPDTGSAYPLLVFLATCVMACVHLLTNRLVFLDKTPRSIWLSLAGGVSVSYVFVHLLPEMAHLQRQEFHNHSLQSTLYVYALAGLVIYYGLERLALTHGGGRHDNPKHSTPAGVFWLHISSFGLYNFLIGYLLHEQARLEGLHGLGLYVLAMALHFLVNDRALFSHHGHLYTAYGRWLLIAAVFAGWGIGTGFEIPAHWIGAGLSLLAGSVILNVIKEELPEERESRFWAFALGAFAYAFLLVL